VDYKVLFEEVRGRREELDLRVARVAELFALPGAWGLTLPHNDQVGGGVDGEFRFCTQTR
jgi:hypothetical protein